MEVTRKDADEYIAVLKQKFQAQPEKYGEFCRVLQKFVQRQVDYPTLILTVVPLIEGHRELVLGLTKFLPKNCTLIDRMISCKKEEVTHKAPDDLTLNSAENLEKRGNSLHEQIDLSLSLAGNFQERSKSSTEQVTTNQTDLAHSLSGYLQQRRRNLQKRKRNSSTKQVQLIANRGRNDGEKNVDSSGEKNVDLSLSIGYAKV